MLSLVEVVGPEEVGWNEWVYVFVLVIVSVVELTVVGFEAAVLMFVIGVTLVGTLPLRRGGVVSFVILVSGVESGGVEKLAGVTEDDFLLVVTTLYVLGKEVDDCRVDEEIVGLENEGRVVGDEDVIFLLGKDVVEEEETIFDVVSVLPDE